MPSISRSMGRRERRDPVPVETFSAGPACQKCRVHSKRAGLSWSLDSFSITTSSAVSPSEAISCTVEILSIFRSLAHGFLEPWYTIIRGGIWSLPIRLEYAYTQVCTLAAPRRVPLLLLGTRMALHVLRTEPRKMTHLSEASLYHAWTGTINRSQTSEGGRQAREVCTPVRRMTRATLFLTNPQEGGSAP